MDKHCEGMRQFFARWILQRNVLPDARLKDHIRICPVCRRLDILLRTDIPSPEVSKRLQCAIRDFIQADIASEKKGTHTPHEWILRFGRMMRILGLLGFAWAPLFWILWTTGRTDNSVASVILRVTLLLFPAFHQAR